MIIFFVVLPLLILANLVDFSLLVMMILLVMFGILLLQKRKQLFKGMTTGFLVLVFLMMEWLFVLEVGIVI